VQRPPEGGRNTGQDRERSIVRDLNEGVMRNQGDRVGWLIIKRVLLRNWTREEYLSRQELSRGGIRRRYIKNKGNEEEEEALLEIGGDRTKGGKTT